MFLILIVKSFVRTVSQHVLKQTLVLKFLNAVSSTTSVAIAYHSKQDGCGVIPSAVWKSQSIARLTIHVATAFVLKDRVGVMRKNNVLLLQTVAQLMMVVEIANH